MIQQKKTILVEEKKSLGNKKQFIHLLYAPTNFCNMSCSYCYLGKGTEEKSNANNVLSTLENTVRHLLDNGYIPFNLSFHGGEVTTLPKKQLESLFIYAKKYYQDAGDEIRAAGMPVNPLHIKTNLYNFKKHYELFDNYEVSISGSVDLPLSLHEQYRLDKQGRSTKNKIIDNLKLLARYPHNKKISCVVTRAHINKIDEFIQDIKLLHYDYGLDMTRFNIMFSFDSQKNMDKFKGKVSGTQMLTEEEQLLLYQKLNDAFKQTELEYGVKYHWFKEFTPDYCCSAINCGEKFFLLQGNGNVYSCPRGQSSNAFLYGNIFQDKVSEIIDNGWKTIERMENELALHEDCFSCSYLPYCHSGCVFVRNETGMTKSYTCQLQQAIYKSNPQKYPAYDKEYIEQYGRSYRLKNNIKSFNNDDYFEKREVNISPELYDPKNSLQDLIKKDAILQYLYSETLIKMTIDTIVYPLSSSLTNNVSELALITPDSEIELSVRTDIFDINCNEPVNNYLLIMLLRNTMVSYGDEQRSKQEHLIDQAIYTQTFQKRSQISDGYYHFNLTPFFKQQCDLFLPKVRNNLYITSKALRDYHYEKQKKNAFYHIQAMNLPFQFLEFYWLDN